MTHPAVVGDSDQPRLGLRYPLAELTTAALALILYSATSHEIGAEVVSAGMALAYAALFVLIGVVDIEQRRIPLATLLPLAGLALFDAAFIGETGPNLASSIVGGLSGFLIFYLVFAGGFLFAAVSKKLLKRTLRGGAIGFGDVMLMSVVGMIVGFPDVLVAICISIFAGAVGAVCVIAGHYTHMGSYSGFARIPYGPYILFGAIVVQLLGDRLTALIPGT